MAEWRTVWNQAIYRFDGPELCNCNSGRDLPLVLENSRTEVFLVKALIVSLLWRGSSSDCLGAVGVLQVTRQFMALGRHSPHPG